MGFAFIFGFLFEFIAFLAAASSKADVDSVAFKVCIISSIIATILILTFILYLLLQSKRVDGEGIHKKEHIILVVLEKIRLICMVLSIISINLSLVCSVL
ncbi:hypothetical protein JGC56_12145 [Salmonella enterica subsp. enterica serovar Saintpaul]|nr:hypothetical protein [Salmonella enterica subsp. enterica serovar Saintpaul]